MKILIIILMATLLAFPASVQATSDSYLIEGGLAGLAIGGGAGVGIGYAAGGTSICRNKLAGMLLFGVGMGALGFASGALIGYHYKKAPKTAFSPTILVNPASGTYALGAGMNF